MMRPGVLLYKGTGLVSKLIRWQTRGMYSHAALLRPDGRVIESWHDGGVRIFRPKSWDGIHAFDVPEMDQEKWEIALRWAEGEVGQPYDWRGVARFISRSKDRKNRRWFCSELVFAALDAAGVPPLLRVPACEVSPAMLGYSPRLLIRQTINE